MFLKRIELQGFKSFADKVVISFDNDIIGVVGPNGCGKSNINDAIRWVLGEKSAKALRGKSMTDVIFSGSTERKAVNMAEVTLVFDNSNNIMNIEFDEVSITRKLHRISGESEYLINKTPCRLKDITELILDTGLGKDSLSFISQGDVTNFASSKPEERRLIFEEAAGVAKYKKRKNESLSKLERTQENLSRAEDIINELENQVRPLKRQAEKANKYIEMKKTLDEIEVSVIVDDIEKLHNKLEDIKAKLFEADTNIAMNKTTTALNDNKSEELRRKMSELDNEVATLHNKLSKVNDQINLLEARKSEIDEKRKYAIENASKQDKIKEIRTLIEETNFEYNDRYQRLSNLKLDEKLYSDQNAQIEIDYAALRSNMENERNKLNTLSNKEEVLKNLLKSPFNHQQGVKAVLESSNNLNGIVGVVSQLFAPKEGYENAVSSALGGAMYHIVTADEYAAKKAINFLKKNQSGRAHFLPITIMRERNLKDEHLFIAQNTKGFLGTVNDYVTCEDRSISIKNSLLGNIILCDNLDNAIELGKLLRHAYQIVTVDGDIVHKGGSMSGGKTRGTQSPLTVSSELTAITRLLDKQRNIVNDLNEKYDDIQTRREEVNDKVMNSRLSIAQLTPVVDAKAAKLAKLKDEYELLNPDGENNVENTSNSLLVELSQVYSQRDEITNNIALKRENRVKIGKEEERYRIDNSRLRREMNELQTLNKDISVEKATIETKLENELSRLSASYEMTFEHAQTLKLDIDIQEAREQVVSLRISIQNLGNVNLEAPEEYENVKERYDTLTKSRDELLSAKKQILEAIDDMDEIMIKQFKESFDQINNELQDVFKDLFGGGKAYLKMVDPNDILNTGIDIIAQPPGKNVSNISLLSGGEKSLIAISVLFSILKARRIPLCIFDEVEAALDQANVERVAKYLSKFKGESQFIVVTHRPGTMAQCDYLYGITMQQNGVSQLLKVKLQDAINMSEMKEGE